MIATIICSPWPPINRQLYNVHRSPKRSVAHGGQGGVVEGKWRFQEGNETTTGYRSCLGLAVPTIPSRKLQRRKLSGKRQEDLRGLLIVLIAD